MTTGLTFLALEDHRGFHLRLWALPSPKADITLLSQDSKRKMLHDAQHLAWVWAFSRDICDFNSNTWVSQGPQNMQGSIVLHDLPNTPSHIKLALSDNPQDVAERNNLSWEQVIEFIEAWKTNPRNTTSTEAELRVFRNDAWHAVVGSNHEHVVPFEEWFICKYMASNFRYYQQYITMWEELVNEVSQDMTMEFDLPGTEQGLRQAFLWYTAASEDVQKDVAGHPSTAHNLRQFMRVCPQVAAQVLKNKIVERIQDVPRVVETKSRKL